MRRLNDIKKVADFIVSNFKPSEFEINECSDGSLDLICPYLPSNILSLVSSNIRIGVFPWNDNSIYLNIYKL